MPTWWELKTQARRTVHLNMRRAAVYTPPNAGTPVDDTPPNAGTPVDVYARVHTKDMFFGDLDREGYARQFEDVTRVVFDADEIVPVRGATVSFADDSTTYEIIVVIPPDGPVERVCEVVRV